MQLGMPAHNRASLLIDGLTLWAAVSLARMIIGG
nr:MAG TPA: hypothetical protein [Caudoviricetes sp.]